jgi:oxygen-independent coproporphyrinogen-3 oxidase
LLDLDALLEGSPYQAYLYSYPHKTAHRPLDQPRPLEALWAPEPRQALFLYFHIPFCEGRCGYCNLFSRGCPPPGEVTRYLDALERQARATREALGAASFARLAFGGGTPSVLSTAELARVLDLSERVMGAAPSAIPSSFEVSPSTASPERLDLLAERGVSRISIGIQSFLPEELERLHRAQSAAEGRAAIEQIRARGFPILNVDLIYGIEGQDEASFTRSLEETLRHQPEEIYLYPLYVRPLTTLGREQPARLAPARGAPTACPSERAWDEQRLALYRLGRDLLRGRGYRQLSMRLFRHLGVAPDAGAPVYHCQEDGMVGLGCGARSYTAGLHYSLEYAVGGETVRAILDGYAARTPAELRVADYGVEIDEEDRRRRYSILSLLSSLGLDLAGYRACFGGDALRELPELAELEARGLARREGELLRLTELGLERSDAIGPALRSARIARLQEEYRLR